MKHNPTRLSTSLCVCWMLIVLLVASGSRYAEAQDYSGFGSGAPPSTDGPNDTEPDESVSPTAAHPPTSSFSVPTASPSPDPGSTSAVEGCVKPVGAASGVTVVSEGEMELTARCYVACLDNLLTREQREQHELRSATGGGSGWLSVPKSLLRENCTLYQKLQECTQGCTSVPTMELSIQESCNSTCYGSCSDTTEMSPFLPESSCLRVCNVSDCETGCAIQSSLPGNLSAEGFLPASPTGRLTVENYTADYLHIPGVFRLSFNASSDIGSGGKEGLLQPAIELTAFVVRVSDMELESDTYFMLESLEDPLKLDLGFLCHKISVSVVPVNKYGKAHSYTEPVDVDVLADPYPGYTDNPNPHEVRIQAEPDTREGFWEHAIITVTWPPASREGLVDSYSVKMSSMKQNKCGAPPHPFNRISKNQRSVTFQASSPMEAPLTECLYTFKVSSNPAEGSKSPDPPTPISYLVEGLGMTNAAPPSAEVPLEFSCTRTTKELLSGVRFDYTVEWSWSGNPALFRNLHEFQLHAGYYRYDEDGQAHLDYEDFHAEKTFSYSKSTYSVSFSTPSSVDNSIKYHVELHSIKIDPNDSRPVPKNYTCIHSILPASPDPVTVFKHAELSYRVSNNTMIVDVAWEEPNNTYGNVLYGLYIGTAPIDPLDAPLGITPPSNALVFKTNIIYSFWYGMAIPMGKVAPGDTVYVQVAAVNKNFLQSNWSSPQEVVMRNVTPEVVENPDPLEVQFQAVPDTREGFWEHAIITVSWPPVTREYLVDSYSVKVSSIEQNKCGAPPQSFDGISKDQRSVTFQASSPTEAPLTECSYTFKVSSNPVEGVKSPDSPTPISYLVEAMNNTVPSDVDVPLELSCTRDEQNFFTGVIFFYTVEWSWSGNPALFRNLQKFQLVTGDYRYDENGQAQLEYEDFHTEKPFNYTKTTYSASFDINSRNDKSIKFHIVLHSVKVDPNDPRPIPKNYTCIHSILPNAPDPVTVFEHAILSYEPYSDVMTVDVVWEEPVNTYGTVLYALYIGTTPLDPSWVFDTHVSTIPPSNALIFKTGLSYSFWYGKVHPLGRVAGGDTVYVQVALENSNFLQSNWSSPQEVVVRNVTAEVVDSYPENPDPLEVRFQAMPDTREGFWEHAIITVSWPPVTREDLVDSYSVKMSSMKQNKCGAPPESFDRISKDQRSVTFQASIPTEAPLTECSYTFKVSSNPVDGVKSPDSPTPISYLVEAMNNTVPPDVDVPLELSCTRDEQSFFTGLIFHYTVEWSWSGNPALFRNLQKFQLDTGDYRYDENGQASLDFEAFSTEKPFSYTKTTYSASFDINSRNDKSIKFHIVLHSVKVDPNDPRPVPKNYTCIHSILPNAPDPVTVFEHAILSYEPYSDVMTVDVLWDEPANTYGNTVLYALYIGTTPIDPSWVFDTHVSTIPPSNALIFKTGLSYSFWYGKVHPLGRVAGGDTVYVQVASEGSNFLQSNWSSPREYIVSGVSVSIAPSPTTEVVESQTSESSSLLPLLGIVPIVFVVFVAVVIVAVLLLVAAIQNKRMSRSVGSKKFSKAPGNLADKYGYYDTQWELIRPNLVLEVSIGQGTFGDVYKATLHSAISPGSAVSKKESHGPREVLVKSLRSDAGDFERHEFYRQLDQYMQVSEADHPFLLTMYGCVTMDTPICVVMEFPEQGSLLSYLISKRTELEDAERGYASLKVDETAVLNDPAGAYNHLEPNDVSLTSADIVSFCRQIASAMDCLAGLGVVHKDLACRNIYVCPNKVLKVADFGIVESRSRHSIYPTELPKRWMALESLIEQVYSTASDVWSFGVTVWEIVTLGSHPYQGTKDHDLLPFLVSGRRLPCPSNCSNRIYSILVHCWQKNPNSRPTFELLHETLLNLHSRGDCDPLVQVALQKPIQTSSKLKEELGMAPSVSVTPVTDSAVSDCQSSPSYTPESPSPVANSTVASSTNLAYRKESLPDSGCEYEEPEVVVKTAKVTNGPCRQSGSSFVLSLNASKSPLKSTSPIPSCVNPGFRKSSEPSVDDAKIIAEMAPDGSSEV